MGMVGRQRARRACGGLGERLERCPRLVFQYCGQGDVTTRFTGGSPIEGERERERGRGVGKRQEER